MSALRRNLKLWWWFLALLLGMVLYLAGVGFTVLLEERWERNDATTLWYDAVQWPKEEVWM